MAVAPAPSTGASTAFVEAAQAGRFHSRPGPITPQLIRLPLSREPHEGKPTDHCMCQRSGPPSPRECYLPDARWHQ